jgi:hypothetical protein
MAKAIEKTIIYLCACIEFLRKYKLSYKTHTVGVSQDYPAS